MSIKTTEELIAAHAHKIPPMMYMSALDWVISYTVAAVFLSTCIGLWVIIIRAALNALT
tara:strand:- start:678 stop:854 length:177 start_codon:yes stop_codon:yes gene_type:complete